MAKLKDSDSDSDSDLDLEVESKFNVKKNSSTITFYISFVIISPLKI